MPKNMINKTTEVLFILMLPPSHRSLKRYSSRLRPLSSLSASPSEDSVFGPDIRHRFSLLQVFTDDVFDRDPLEDSCHHLFLRRPRDNHDAVAIGKDQIAGEN